MPTEGVPSTMVVGAKTFNLAGLINESVLDLQMANVFKVLKKLSSLIDTQAGQIQALQTKVTKPQYRKDIGPLRSACLCAAMPCASRATEGQRAR